MFSKLTHEELCEAFPGYEHIHAKFMDNFFANFNRNLAEKQQDLPPNFGCILNDNWMDLLEE